MLTTDPLYYKPLKPKITIKNLANNTIFYTFDPFSDPDSSKINKPISLSLGLSENSFGTFALQIEDQDNILNRDNINKGARVIVEVGKLLPVGERGK